MADETAPTTTVDPVLEQKSGLVHLHNHSEYSSLDGGSRVKDMVAKLESLGMKAMALTDHGVMQGLPTFYNELKKAGIKPILGIEAYLTNDRHLPAKGTPTWHLTLLAETTEGYHNLCKLSSRAFIEGTIITFGRARARADWELLEEYSKGVIAFTGCMASPVMGSIFGGDLAAAKAYTERLISTYGAANVYGEIQNVGITSGIPGDSEIAKLLGKTPLTVEEASRYEEVEAGQVPLSQTEANGILVDYICKPLGLKYVATGDTHYLNEDDANPHDIMICIGTSQTKKGQRRFSLLPKKYHMRAEEEMLKALAQWPEAIECTKEVALRCNAEIEYGRELLPAYPIPEEFADSGAYLRHLCEHGLDERYPEGSERRQEAIERLEMELGVIGTMGFNDYFLITWDLYNEANRRDIPSGPGRGSAAGSIVAYTLDITKLCPLEYDLLFERFLNPGRKSMPDIDMDFAEGFNGGRKALMQYAVEKYNGLSGCETAVSQIVTYQRYKAKNAIKDAARVLAEPDPPGEDFNKKEAMKLGDRLSALVPGFPDVTMGSLWDGKYKREGEALRAAQKKGGLSAEIINQAGWLEGMIKTYGLHAAAVIIASHDMTEDLPLQKFGKGPDKPLHTQYDMGICEALGLLKMDFLGLKTLDIIWDACKKIEAVHGRKIYPWRDIPIEDAKTYELFAAGETVGTFQFESSGMRASLQEVRPTELRDLIALVALYRPGAMAHIPTYAARKNGRQEVSFADPRLEEILKETFGVCVSGNAIIVDAENGCRHRLEDLRDHEGMLVQGVDENLRPATGRISRFIDSGVKDVLRVKLANGASVKVTADHRLLTERGWKPLSNLRIGDYIGTPKQLFGSGITVPADPRKLRILGYLIADGDLGNAATAFVNKEPLMLKAYVDALTAFPDVKPVYYQQVRGVTRIAAGRQDAGPGPGYHQPSSLLLWMRELGLKWKRVHGGKGGVGSADKFVPEFVFELGDEDIALFLAALWDCDGYAGARTWHYKTISSRLAADVQALLLRLGICSTIHEVPYTNPSGVSRVAYAVTVHDTLRLAQLLQPHMRHPRKRGVESTAVTRGSTIDVNPYAMEVRGLGKPLRLLERETGVLVRNHVSASRIRSHPRIYQESVRQATAVLSLPQTEQLLECNWQRIVAIEPIGLEHVYDLTVEGIHSFIADGVIVHNCVYQEQSMLTARAVAGFSQAEADDLRKAIGKKLRDKMDALKPKYLKGVVENGGTKELGETLWADNEAAADYSFNKCAYAGTIVRTADGRRIKLSAAYREQPRELMAMWTDGRIAPHAVKRIVQTGRKPLYEVRTQGGRQIKVTAEHRLLTTDGYQQVQDMKIGTELITVPVYTEEECARRSSHMRSLDHSPERVQQDKRAAVRMREWQAGRTAEEKAEHMRRVHASHSDMTNEGVRAMHARIAWLRANDSDWVLRHAEASLASVRATYDTGPGFGRCSTASNGMRCASSHERAMCEHLIECGIDFEMHKVLPNGRICDFYFAGIYWEMDGMDREDAFFADKYGELPYVVVTPEDYRFKIENELALEHAQNGDPIISIEYWGDGPTYDVEMCEGGPKNFLANNIVSHNSHAACYAYVSYITGWLKVNYPHEFMAALLTVAMGDKDKPRIFLTEAKRMGLRVLPPDVNRSFSDFAVVEREDEEGSYDILFGLTAIRGVGDGVVREIRAERERHGFFTSIFDLIRRMPSLNKTVLHALVKGGALDCTGATRKGMFDVAEEAQKAIKKERDAEEKAFINAVKARAEATATAVAAASAAGATGEQQQLLTGIDDAFAAATTKAAPKTAKGGVKLTMEEKRALEGGCKTVWATGLEVIEEDVVSATADALKKEALRLARKDAKESLKDESGSEISGIAQEEQSETSLKDRAEEIAQAVLEGRLKEIEEQAAEYAQRFLPFIREEVLEREDGAALDAALASESEMPLSSEEWDRIERLNVERNMLGIYVTGHPLDEDAEQWRAYVNDGTERGRELGQVSDGDIGNTVIIVGALISKTATRMRSGETMYRATLEDLSGSREVTIFPRTLEGGLDQLLTEGQIICMEVGVQEDTFQQQRNDEAADGEEMAEDEEAAGRPIKLIASRLYRWDASKITPEFVAKAQARARERAAQAEAAGLSAIIEADSAATTAPSADAAEAVSSNIDTAASESTPAAPVSEIKPVVVQITSAQFNPEWVKRLEAVCSEHPGNRPVKLILDGKPYSTKFAVALSPVLSEAIRTLLRTSAVSSEEASASNSA